MHEHKFKYLLSSTCQVSVERIVLDLESEAMRGLGSIPTGGNILSLDFFCFYVVKTKMPQLAFLCVCEKQYRLTIRVDDWTTKFPINSSNEVFGEDVKRLSQKMANFSITEI